MNNVKLLHIKCCFFQFFNSLVALKNLKKFWPPRKSWNDAPEPNTSIIQLVIFQKRILSCWAKKKHSQDLKILEMVVRRVGYARQFVVL